MERKKKAELRQERDKREKEEGGKRSLTTISRECILCILYKERERGR
jgi:hypothetical protein